MRRALPLAFVAILLTSSAFAQSIPTATITGKVTVDNAAIPGVTVTVKSPQLQGTRTAVSAAGGDYILPFLPPGDYTVTFELEGMQTATRKLTLTAARTDRIDIDLRPAAIAESITVTAATPSVIESTEVSANFKQNLVEQLPVPRDVRNITLLSPGVNDKGPSGGNIIISGAMSYDSLYLVNGAIVNENLRGQPHALFIEDAIQETTVQTAGVSAEYGHFTGGVVNMITKSGGNDLKGSFRTSLSNESWSSKTPLTIDQDDKINPIYEATLGGPIMRDRIWFFGAGRSAKSDDIRQTVMGGARQGDRDVNGNPFAKLGDAIPPLTYPHATDERRIEGKLTGTLTPKHSLIASYLDINASEKNQTGQVIMDLDSLVPERQTPNSIAALNYNGVLTSKIFAEAQYSKKKFKFVHSGSSFYDDVKGTLITDRARGTRYWSPTFRNTDMGERRDITDYTGKATYFLSHPRLGSQEIRLGYEHFNEVRAVNNYQNGSDYRISVPETIVRGTTVYPRMPGGTSGSTRISWLPIFVLSEGSDYTTKSTYINDRWTLNPLWTFNIGIRYDKNDAMSGAHTFKIADDSAFSPRLGVHYDPFANGRLILNASYSQYVGRLSEGAANDADPAGRNASLQWNYQGPNINNDVTVPTSQLIPTDQAIRMIFDWFNANGGTNRRPFRTTPSVPGVDTILDPNGLQTPGVNEWVTGVATTFGATGFARGDLVWRKWDRFYTAYRDVSTGRAKDQFGTEYDRAIIRTDNNTYNRDYRAVQTQFGYRFFRRLDVGGTYTWSKLTGNVTGEDTGSGPLVGDNSSYPEYKRASWNYPTGKLTGDQTHRARLWAGYDIPTKAGAFNVSVLQSFDSGAATSIDGVVDSRPFVTNPGYLTPPATVTYYFGGRGTIKSDNITHTDLALNYRLKVFGGVEFFLQPEIVNLFNQHGVESFDEEVLTNVDCPGGSSQASACPASGLKAFNPFTETPVKGVNYITGPSFGKPTSEGDYQQARTFRVSFGIRF
jgi:outer membrane receptor for ferrienterochelin and colicin